MFLPLLTLLLRFGEIQRYMDIILLSSNPEALPMARSSLFSRFGQFSFITLNQTDRDEVLYSLNFRSSPNLVCILVNDTSEEAGLEETTWFLNGMVELCGMLVEGMKNSLNRPTSNSDRVYLWHNSICLCIMWAKSPKMQVKMDEEVLRKILRSRVPKDYKLDSCLYFWFMDSGLFFEVYYFKNDFIVRKVRLEHGGSSVKRRMDFEMTSITAGHVRRWGGISPNGKTTLSFSDSKTYIFLAYMQDYLNFTVIFVSNPAWVNMSEKVKSGKIDIGISATAMIPSLTTDLRFLSTPTYTEQLVAYFNQPDESDMEEAFVHIKPFSKYTWFVMFLVLTLLFLVHYGMSREINNSWWYVLACLTNQGYSVGVTNSIRIVTFIGALLFVILYALYSGELISSLSTKTERVYSVHELIELGFTFGIRNDSYLRAAKATGDFGEDSLAAKIFSHLHETMGQPGMDEALIYIFKHDRYAFINEENVYDRVMSLRKRVDNYTVCHSFRDTPIPEYTVQQTPIVRRDSQFVDHFNLARLRLTETGIWNVHWKRADWNITYMRPQCNEPQTTSFEIRDVLLPLFTMICGFVASILIFVFEVIWVFRTEDDKVHTIVY